MISVATIKSFINKYYPKDHLLIAGGLAALFVLVVLLPSEEADAVKAPALTLEEADAAAAPSVEPDTLVSTPQPESLPAAQDIDMNAFVVEAEPQLEDTAIESWQAIEVQPGDNLSAIFSKVGLSDRELFEVLNSSEEARVLNRLYPGYQLDFMIPEQGGLEQLRVLSSPLEGYLFKRDDSGYQVERILKQAELRQSFKVGTIADSLFMAGQQENIPAVHIMEMANIFGGVIDFILDPRAGDQFSILFEEQYLDGEYVGTGEILATRYVNEGKEFVAVRYVDEEGEVGYYSPEGESMRKAFLRNPMDVFRISSNFNPRRRHPILNTIRAHKGTDYAAPRGTPVMATGDGRVSWAARNGSFGNLVVVKHAGGFETKYAHLSRFAVNKGERVRQGEVIGYVGSTGGATGPHLHYEFLVNGVHQNPRTILDRLPKAKSIDPAEMARFKSQTQGLIERFSELNGQRLLTLNEPGAD